MYKVYDPRTDVTYSYWKTHWISTEAIADEVLEDLNARELNSAYMEQVTDGNECTWDPGGMMMTGDEVFVFPLNNIVIRCKAQHFQYFLHTLDEEAKDLRGDKAKYYKIHGRWCCICISPEEFEQLMSLVQDKDLLEHADKSRKERQRRINKLSEEGHVIQAVQGDDGKLYKVKYVDEPEEIDKKLLN